MAKKFKLCVNYAYYENPGMLQIHLETWAKYAKDLRKAIEFAVTDDCSPRNPVGGVLEASKSLLKGLNVQAYRITRKVPWNYLAARNIGAFYAEADYLLTTDMDLLLTEENAAKIVEKIDCGTLKPDYYYRVNRRVMPAQLPYKDHPDTWLMSRDLYWVIGGNDEEYAGMYGTDGDYKHRADRSSKGGVKLDDVFLLYYPRGFLPDSGTSDFPRKEGRTPEELDRKFRRMREKRLKDLPPVTMSFPYERISL